MSDSDKTENEQVPIPPAELEEEIIFPARVSDKPQKPAKGFPVKLSPAKLLILVILVIAVYFAGYLTSQENFLGTVTQIKEWISASKETVAPYQDKLTEAIETRIKKKETEPSQQQMKEGQMPSIKEKRKIKYWKAPMDPTYVRDKPGKSPMGMDLVPVYEGEAEGEIKISPTIAQNMGIKTEKVKSRTLKHEIRTVGNLTYDERKVHHVHTKYGGWIEKLHVDFTGQEVKQSDLLLEIYSPELVSTQEELVLALKYKQSLKDSPYGELSEAADSLLASTRKRLELFDVQEHQIEALIRDQKITKTMHIHSPVRGFVIEKKALEGMHVQPGMSLYMIADLSNIWVLADIYEYEVPWIKVGQNVEMNLSYFPGKKFSGKVTFIDPFLNPATRTLKVRMEFPNPNWELKPDMYANVTIESTVVKRGLTVPEQSVIHSGEKTMVIVAKDSGQYESREVTLGVLAQGYYRVIKGLRKGEQVVVSSGFLIDSESKLQEAIGKLQNFAPKPPIEHNLMKSPPGQLMPQIDNRHSGETMNNNLNH
ncbi:MAG: efflux RND transporter periplasmic adaptor subunit [Nitrospinota bacterium]|nr:efflux RND transporter periplasmic adaptor subunit [Nitrospinota bacterium]